LAEGERTKELSTLQTRPTFDCDAMQITTYCCEVYPLPLGEKTTVQDPLRFRARSNHNFPPEPFVELLNEFCLRDVGSNVEKLTKSVSHQWNEWHGGFDIYKIF
jgi:hypothetical protein